METLYFSETLAALSIYKAKLVDFSVMSDEQISSHGHSQKIVILVLSMFSEASFAA
jgi:hypothetical protein